MPDVCFHIHTYIHVYINTCNTWYPYRYTARMCITRLVCVWTNLDASVQTLVQSISNDMQIFRNMPPPQSPSHVLHKRHARTCTHAGAQAEPIHTYTNTQIMLVHVNCARACCSAVRRQAKCAAVCQDSIAALPQREPVDQNTEPFSFVSLNECVGGPVCVCTDNHYIAYSRHVCVYKSTCLCVYIHTYIHTHIHIHTYMHTHTYKCMYVCMYIYTYIYIYIYIKMLRIRYASMYAYICKRRVDGQTMFISCSCAH